jgi:hypothetical protein
VRSQFAQPSGLLERRQTGCFRCDEEAVKVGVDVALGDRGGSRYPIAGLYSGESTHPRDLDVTDFERTHNSCVIDDPLILHLESGGLGKPIGHGSIEAVEKLLVLIGYRRDLERGLTGFLAPACDK